MRPLLFSQPRRGLSSANQIAPRPRRPFGNQARLRGLSGRALTRSFGDGDPPNERVTLTPPAGAATPTSDLLSGVEPVGVPAVGLQAPPVGAAPTPPNCGVHSGPTYTPSGAIPVNPVGADGLRHAPFSLAAVFRTASATSQSPGCCSVRQFIMWDTRFHTQAGGPPHSGFPSSSPANTWIEDRDTSGGRYGHRSGPHSAPGAGCADEYLTAGRRDQTHGDTYCGRDSPGGFPTDVGTWSFQLKVIDTCAGGEKAVSPVITVRWG